MAQREEEAFMATLLSGLDAPVRRSKSFGANVTPQIHNDLASTRRYQSTSNQLQPHPESLNRTHPSSSSNPAPPSNQDYSWLLEGIDFDDGDDEWENEMLADKSKEVQEPAVLQLNPPSTEPPPGWTPRCWVRCQVLEIRAQEGTDARGFRSKEVEVLVHKSDRKLTLELKEEFADLPLFPNDILNVIAPLLSSPTELSFTFSTSFPENFIILHPDLLIPNTTISSSLSCPRKSILQRLLKSNSTTSKSLLYGNILHTTLQTLFSTVPYPTPSTFSSPFIRQTVEKILNDESVKSEVYRAGLSWEEVRTEVKEKAAVSFGHLADRFLGVGEEGGRPNEDATLHQSTETLALTGLHGIEEDIRSPMWGLQGKIDVSVQATLLSLAGKTKMGGREERGSWTMPFEIKTGRAIGMMEHRAQTMIYTLLMEDRYSTPIPAGLLYYTQSDTIIKVPAARFELRSLIMARNTMASYMSRKRSRITKDIPSSGMRCGVSEAIKTEEDIKTEEESEEPSVEEGFLPPHSEDSYGCKKCYQLDSCMLYRRAVENVEDYDSPVAELYDDKTSHLTQAHAEFFKKWEHLVSLEEQDVTRFQAELWTMTAAEREKSGRCFSKMGIESYSLETGQNRTKVHRHNYTFTRISPSASTSSVAPGEPDRSLLSGHLSVGDPVTVSIEPNLYSLARGFILELSPSSVRIGLDNRLDTDVLLAKTRTKPSATGHQQPFRIDKDELVMGMSRIRDNLAQLFYTEGSARLRSLVVDLQTPKFDFCQAPFPNEIPSHLNADQQDALTKVLTATDYALVLGMPGTGKTTTIVEVIKALAKRGKSVLLTSYTHSAVDTIMAKLAKTDLKLLRLGNPDKVHPDVAHLTLGAQGPSADLNEFEQRLMSPQVVATTALTIDHPLFTQRKFDYCIVDEASQITLPVCLGPLRFAHTFVLVGDHFQLPPLVKNPSARLGGLETSLFRTLHEAHPSASVDLSHQYRMNEDIMKISNELIYDQKLKCGSETIAKQRLDLPGWDRLDKEGEKWLIEALDPKHNVVFINTDEVPCEESRVGDLVQNVGEATLAQQITQALLLAGLPANQLGVITPHRQQIKLLENAFDAAKIDGVEILTADKSQGRDKECVVVSMVRSNKQGSVGKLLQDKRRTNVMFTRAKSKLIILGSRSTVARDPLLAQFLGLINRHGWMQTLPPGTVVVPSPSPSDPPCSEGLLPVETEVGKREGSDLEDDKGEDGESTGLADCRPARVVKKMKLGANALVKTRPLLRDILNETMDDP